VGEGGGQEAGRTVLRRALVVDGTGAPGRRADVVLEGDRIAAVTGPGEATAGPGGAGAAVVDLDGLVLAPGFVDIHTHYDAQVLWDPDLTPSCWHGVTTVVMGNCGFGLAPTRPEGRLTAIRTLENVEGMSAAALEAGVDWCFESFPDYLDALDARPLRLNVAAFVGHSPLRLYVLGDEASDREATPEEIATMRALVVEAVQAGALGFATSKVPVQNGAGGKPVPSRLASFEELRALVDALREVGAGVVEAAAGPGLGFDELASLAAESGRTVCLLGPGQSADGESVAGRLDRFEAAGLWAQAACRPIVFQVTLLDPFPFGTIPAFREVLAGDRQERRRLYEDGTWRARARPGWDAAEPTSPQLRKLFVAETTARPELVGRSVHEVAAERGVHPLDVLVDVALADDLAARFTVVFGNDDPDAVAELLRDERMLVGLSDAGAHASQICDAVFTTSLLREWVRERGVLTLESAVRRLTSLPAAVFGLAGRGEIRPGWHADLVAFDPATVGPEPARRVTDLPAGADRLIAGSVGITHTWVNGRAIRFDGVDVAGPRGRPGRLLRGAGWSGDGRDGGERGRPA
jgi:N-acyl-D-aspartate/D-glutamate deacylase